MKLRPELILLDGATGAGKSTLLAALRESYQGSVTVGAKLTTRRRRPTDSDWEAQFVDQIPAVHGRYSFCSVGNWYAVDVSALREAIACRTAYAISCVDRQIVERLKADFTAVVFYVYRTWAAGEFEALLTSRGGKTGADNGARRREAASIAGQYVSKIDIYDHVLLNLGTPDDLLAQFFRILGVYGILPDATAHGGSRVP